MAILYKSRKGTSLTLNMNKFQLVQMSYARYRGADYLRSSQTEAAIKNELLGVEPVNLSNTLGVTSPAVAALRAKLIYIGSASTDAKALADKADKAGSEFSKIMSTADEKGSNAIQIVVTYEEMYNVETGSYALMYPVSVSVNHYK